MCESVGVLGTMKRQGVIVHRGRVDENTHCPPSTTANSQSHPRYCCIQEVRNQEIFGINCGPGLGHPRKVILAILLRKFGAGDGDRTRNIQLGNVP
jgi:hypothetical protein